MTIAPAHVERFREDVQRLLGRTDPGRIGVAVSGGPDSLALLLLAWATFDGRVSAATVDHGLRPESREEALFAGRICASIGCPHVVLKVAVAERGMGVQGEARRARYAALRAWAENTGISVLFTAHHADDQAETLLMRLQRGAGLAGLSGIRPVRFEGPSLKIARPLLEWRREELGKIVASTSILPVDDPSNRDARYDRVAMRRLLADNPVLDPVRLTKSAAILGQAEDALVWTAEHFWADRARLDDGAWRVDVTDLPREIRRRLLLHAIADLHARHAVPPGARPIASVDGLLASLESGKTATFAGVKGSASGHLWRIAPAPRRRIRG
ncbi:tRNA lysidine(34) synthetase TilS [Allosphingosinicella flava]|uniref:tRNA(Ile)-lysidine synthase n=1 Tax=Allosphingosinicella flava TaxID=2771430 RepID=A0A7T2LLY7_9SPHN|nr:tRNA lysidine(34) synthetase TilS [Sphingosinicella flava]QPQ54939.1 tRNA lysidine(34) synthetase TilS [Sphingosinicella flava]